MDAGNSAQPTRVKNAPAAGAVLYAGDVARVAAFYSAVLGLPAKAREETARVGRGLVDVSPRLGVSMFSRAYILVGLVGLAVACRVNGPVIGQTADVRPTREPALAAEVTLEVVTKQAPDALFARDGSTCRVAPDVYAATRVGTMFRCSWVRN